MTAFHNDGTHRDQEQAGIEQGNEHRTFAVAIRKMSIGMNLGKFERHKNKDQTKDIAQIMASIRKKRQGVMVQTDSSLNAYKDRVQNNGKNEDATE